MADTEGEAAMADEQDQEGFHLPLPGQGARGSPQAHFDATMGATSSEFPVQFSSFPAASAPLSTPPAAPSLFPVAGNVSLLTHAAVSLPSVQFATAFEACRSIIC